MNDKIDFNTFVEQVSLESGFDFDTTKEYIEDMFDTIIEESGKGRWVKIRKFGSFQPRWYEAKRGINPQTQQPLDILPHYHIHFAASKGLEKVLNAGRNLTPITLKEPSGIVEKVLLVFLVALIIGWMYRAFLMPTLDLPKQLEPQKQEVIVSPLPLEPKEVATVVKESIIPETPKDVVIQKDSTVVDVPKKEAEHTVNKGFTPPTTYTVQADETLTQLGLTFYKNTAFWPLIYKANESKIHDPDHLIKGNTLWIPAIKKDNTLQNAYLTVHETYLNVDKMGPSFWILCEGSQFMGKSFQNKLKKELDTAEYKIIERCMNNKK